MVPILNQNNPVNAITTYFSEIHFNIVTFIVGDFRRGSGLLDLLTTYRSYYKQL
jgi:hypothetical protein